MTLLMEDTVERTVLIVSAIEYSLYEVEYWVRRGKNILQSEHFDLKEWPASNFSLQYHPELNFRVTRLKEMITN